MAVLVGLTGCAQQQLEEKQSAAKAHTNAAMEVCLAALPRQVGNAVARAKCINDATNQYRVEVEKNTDADLVQVSLATRAKLAPMADRRELSYEDYELQLAQTTSAMTQEAQARQSDRAAQQTARTAAVMPPLMQMTQPQPIYTPLHYNQSLTCTHIGNTSYCN